jgi:SAM-dependent methyltransferase
VVSSVSATSQAADKKMALSVRPVRHCPACGETDPCIAYAADENGRAQFRQLSARKFGGAMDGWEDRLSLAVLRCPACGHFWHADQPDQTSLFAMYAANARQRSGERALPDDRLRAIRQQARLLYRLVVRRGAVRPSMLDYGSGGGIWCEAFTAAGFDVTAYEPVSERTHDDGVSGDTALHSLDGIGERVFNAVNLEQVLEHVPDPVEELMRLRPLCAPGAVIRITVPDFGAFAAREAPFAGFPYGGRTHLLSPYEHLHRFSSGSLRAALRAAGFCEIGAVAMARVGAWRAAARRQLAFVRPSFAGTQVFARPVRRQR